MQTLKLLTKDMEEYLNDLSRKRVLNEDIEVMAIDKFECIEF